MNKEKRLLKEKKKQEKKIKKQNQKRTKELKSILDWMDIQSIDELNMVFIYKREIRKWLLEGWYYHQIISF